MRNAVWLAMALAGLGAQGCGSDAPPDPCSPADKDGDGAKAEYCGGNDCDDNDARRHPGSTEVCDRENLDEDCDPRTFGERDSDRDGSFDAQCCNGTECGEDCNDLARGTNPNAPESCDRVDNDCDGAIDEGVAVVAYVDEDGDGWGVGDAAMRCAGAQSYATVAGDCDDSLPDIHPGAFRCSTEASAKSSDIQVCGADAMWTDASCPDLGLCVVQPDATGVCLPGEASPECADGMDNDMDGQFDIADGQCTSPLDNSEAERACADGDDNDMDGLADFPDDPGCTSSEDDAEADPASLPACANGLDDDGDGAADYYRGTGDPGCVSAADTSERQPDGPTCDNGIDDDENGKLDFPDDVVCANAAADTEQRPACNNGIDDDLDGLTDFGNGASNDPGCSATGDGSERNIPNSNYPCDNGVDDDKDGVADFPGDVGCTSISAQEK